MVAVVGALNGKGDTAAEVTADDARVVDHVRDAAGRPGVGLAFEGAPEGYAWVFDSSSLVYLGTTETALLDVGVTDRKGEAPRASASPR